MALLVLKYAGKGKAATVPDGSWQLVCPSFMDRTIMEGYMEIPDFDKKYYRSQVHVFYGSLYKCGYYASYPRDRHEKLTITLNELLRDNIKMSKDGKSLSFNAGYWPSGDMYGTRELEPIQETARLLATAAPKARRTPKKESK
jgi:hypothetical protein